MAFCGHINGATYADEEKDALKQLIGRKLIVLAHAFERDPECQKELIIEEAVQGEWLSLPPGRYS